MINSAIKLAICYCSKAASALSLCDEIDLKSIQVKKSLASHPVSLPSLRKVPILRVTGKKRRKNGAAAAAAGSGLLLPSLLPCGASGTEDGTAGPNSDVKRGGTDGTERQRPSQLRTRDEWDFNKCGREKERESARERENGVKKSVKWCRFFVQ